MTVLKNQRPLRGAAALGLCGVLVGMVAAPLSAQDSASDSEAVRLRELLMRHHAQSDTLPADDDGIAADDPLEFNADTASKGLAQPFSADKVLLMAEELPLLAEAMQQRLQSPLLEERRSESTLIGSVQTRQRGSLVASTRYSLTHIGKYQFVGRVRLQQGRNTISVQGQEWDVDVPTQELSGSHLILLYAPPTADAELHAVPESAVALMNSDLPGWLAAALPDAATP